MADVKDGSGRDARPFATRWVRDNADGTFAEEHSSELRGWDATSLVWTKLPVDHSTGALKVSATLNTGSIEIGTVDQGSPGATAWKVDGSAVIQPVSGTFWQATQPVSLASVPTHPVTNAGVFAVQASWASAQHVIVDTAPTTAVTGTFWQATQPVSGTVAVTGTFWQATQPVSGPLTDTQLRATAVPVSGSFFQATQPVSIAAMPSTPVTGTFFQATQPVSVATLPSLAAGSAVIGHVIVDTAPTTAVTGPVTDTQIRATPLPVSGTVAVSNFPATQPVSWASPQHIIVDSGTENVTVQNASLAVTAASLPLPTSAATEATLGRIADAVNELAVASILAEPDWSS